MASNRKKYLIKPRKIPYYFVLGILTIGASLILGFLSFGGMYALLPVLSLAFAAFGLSVAYEGEIYLQNIKGSIKKLFKSNYLEHHLAKGYLLNHVAKALSDDECPQFFKDYEAQLKLLAAFDAKKLNRDSKKRKKQIEKTLTDMEKWFALHLFTAGWEMDKEETEYESSLRVWLANHEQEEWQALFYKRQATFDAVKVFSMLSAVFMGLGSTYLIMEAFSVIPLMAAIPFVFWPFIIVPMAIIAGAAYGMLSYNTITDLINNDTLRKWYYKLRNDLSNGLTARNLFVASIALVLVGLALALTICTAGTWWTVATSARPLFAWMGKMPSFIMGVINPIITGLSAIFFNIQNSAESLEMVDNATRSDSNFLVRAYHSLKHGWTQLCASENWLQRVNPFRLVLKLTVTPLRILLFLGHLLSIALTSDRMPGVSQVVAALIAIISEGFEDAHYFLPSGSKTVNDEEKQTEHLLEERLAHAEEHNDSGDIPTRVLHFLASPLYALAAGWDYLASQFNHPSSEEASEQRTVLTLAQAWNKQRGIHEEVDVLLPAVTPRPSKQWQAEHAVSLIEKYERKHCATAWVGAEVAERKKTALQELKSKIRNTNPEQLGDILTAEHENEYYNQHRLFAPLKNRGTRTQAFIEELPERVNAV